MEAPVLNLRALQGDRFDRARRLGWFDPERLAGQRVLMVGAGAVGNEAVKNLALAGFRRITVVDMDRVERTNLSRCMFFGEGDEGRPKAEVVAQRVRAIDPGVRAETFVGKVQDLGPAFAEHSLVLGAVDNGAARMFLNGAARAHGIPYVDAGTYGMVGKVQVVHGPARPCLECTMNRTHMRILQQRFSCTGDGMVFVDRPMPAEITTTCVVAAVQVREAIKLAHGLEGQLLPGIFYYDGERNVSELVEASVDERCPHHADATKS